MLGERIKMVRLSREMTQEELGKIIGVGKSTINKYELNKIAIPSAKIEAWQKRLTFRRVILWDGRACPKMLNRRQNRWLSA